MKPDNKAQRAAVAFIDAYIVPARPEWEGDSDGH
jgi:hypothetical protein